MGSPKLPQCAHCPSRPCAARTDTPGEGGGACMLEPLSPEQRADAVAFYAEGEPAAIMAASDLVMAQSIPEKWSHFQEIVAFCRAMNFDRIGIATCISFHDESRVLSRMLKDEGFTVYSAICKTGEVCKGEVGLDVPDPDCPVCNPMRQAQLLNEAGTQLNINLGLCIGHDALFTKLSDGLVTTYFSKDYAHDHCAILDLRPNQ